MLLILALTLAAAIGAAMFARMLVLDRTYVGSPAYSPQGTPDATTAVIYYSRSGHSEAVALEIAAAHNCRVARIDAEYPRNWAGLRKAGADTKTRALPPIQVEASDLAMVRRLYLVAPTWWFRPATPLWSYVEQTDLTGKEVVLVTTGNSRFKQVETDALAGRIAARGGRLVDHWFFRRGRIFWQKSRDDLLQEVRARLVGPTGTRS